MSFAPQPQVVQSHLVSNGQPQVHRSAPQMHEGGENPTVYSQIGDMAPTNHVSSNLTKEQLVYSESVQREIVNPGVSYV